jgi:hypothetical protein
MIIILFLSQSNTDTSSHSHIRLTEFKLTSDSYCSTLWMTFRYARKMLEVNLSVVLEIFQLTCPPKAIGFLSTNENLQHSVSHLMGHELWRKWFIKNNFPKGLEIFIQCWQINRIGFINFYLQQCCKIFPVPTQAFSIAFYDSQGHGEGIRPHLHMG